MKVDKILTKKKLLLLFFIISLILAWSCGIDKLAYQQNLESMKENVAVILMLKGINIITSGLNGIPAIGGIFEPFDDYMDRIANVMFIATASLGLQKIILVLMQSFFVNLLLSLNVIVVIGNGFMNFLSETLSQKLLKLVVFMIFIRFAVPMLTFTSVALETQLESFKLEKQENHMKELKSKLLELVKMSDDKKKLEEDKEKKLSYLEKRLENLEERKENILDMQNNIKNENKSKVERFTSFFHDDNEYPPEMKEKLLPFINELNGVKAKIDSMNIAINTLNGPSFADKLMNPLSSFDISTKIKKLKVQVSALSESMIDTFFILAIKFFFINVFFPIFFLWALFKVVDRIFTTDYSNKLEELVENRKIKNRADITK